MTVHYLSATAIATPDGDRHLAFCGARFDYSADQASFVVANYGGPKGVTHFRCVLEYARIYPGQYRAWVCMERSLRADKAAGIEYDWITGQFIQNGKVME